ncbi:MAG: FGGY-family carbohydrate kinase [Bacillota bacterium]
MREEYVLAIDCGTQSVRALVFDRDGNLIVKEKVEFEPYFSHNPGWAEQDPELYWRSACYAIKKIKEEQPDIFKRVIGVSVTTQRDTGVFVDKEGNVLRPAIIWLDQRMAKCSEPLSMLDNLMFSTVGMQKTIGLVRKKSKANWVKENQPDIWKKTYKYLHVSGYFTFKLTGMMVDSTANQVGHIPYDYKNKCWPKSNKNYRWNVFGLDRDKLPELVEPGKIIGAITAKAAEETGLREGLPFVTSGSDKSCETLGVGCLDETSASISFGTTATIQTTTGKYYEPIQFFPSYTAVIPGRYNPEIEINRGYWMISWFKKEFSSREVLEAKERNIPPEELLNELLSDIPPGSHGLMLQPYWGAAHKLPEAKGAILGFGDVHTRAHIYRSIIEGINYALLDGAEKIERKSRKKIQRIMLSGGGSQSDTICQITADMFNRPVYKGITYEASGLGAAISCMVGLGSYKSYEEAVKGMVRYSKEFTPDSSNAEIYAQLYNRVYTKIYSKIRGLYKEIQDITKYPEY